MNGAYLTRKPTREVEHTEPYDILGSLGLDHDTITIMLKGQVFVIDNSAYALLEQALEATPYTLYRKHLVEICVGPKLQVKQ